MEGENVKSKVLSSLFWKFMERSGTQGIQIIVQIILARLLVPNDYGIISLIAIFIYISNVFIQSGFSTALIQKKETNEYDYSSVLFISTITAGLLYIILFFTAPLIAYFYGLPQLISIIRVLSLTLFFVSYNSIANAVISRSMQFKKLFYTSLGAIIVSGTVGIAFAYTGFGVWTLVAQQLTNQIMNSFILGFTVKWRPKLIFSLDRIKGLFLYGWKIMISSLIDTLYKNLRGLIIGKLYSPAMLGYYNTGDQYPQALMLNINSSIQAIMLPVLASEQDNRQRVKDMVRRSVSISSFIVFPMMFGFAAVAEPLVRLLLTDKWLPCVPFMQIACMYYILYPIHSANLQAINALGRSDIFLRLEIINKIIGLIILGVTVYKGVYAIAIGMVVSETISTFINSYPNLKLLNYSYKEQLKDFMPPLIISLIMGAAVYSIRWFYMAAWLTIITQVCTGIVMYVGMSRIFKLECYTYLIITRKDLLQSMSRKTSKAPELV